MDQQHDGMPRVTVGVSDDGMPSGSGRVRAASGPIAADAAAYFQTRLTAAARVTIRGDHPDLIAVDSSCSEAYRVSDESLPRLMSRLLIRALRSSTRPPRPRPG